MEPLFTPARRKAANWPQTQPSGVGRLLVAFAVIAMGVWLLDSATPGNDTADATLMAKHSDGRSR